MSHRTRSMPLSQNASAAAFCSAPTGRKRPGARLVSNLLAANPAGDLVNDRDYTAMVSAWGQFLDHDRGLTGTAVPRERLPIAVPAGDAAFNPAGTGTATISMARSAFDPATGTGTGNPRQRVNAITAFIDGSQVYGADDSRAAALREFAGGRLRDGDRSWYQNALPADAAQPSGPTVTLSTTMRRR